MAETQQRYGGETQRRHDGDTAETFLATHVNGDGAECGHAGIRYGANPTQMAKRSRLSPARYPMGLIAMHGAQQYRTP